jgi:hypothetical protein
MIALKAQGIVAAMLLALAAFGFTGPEEAPMAQIACADAGACGLSR